MTKDEKKKEEELACLKKFENTPIGSNWCSQNSIIGISNSEHPDFLLQTKNGEIIGLELANIIAENENTRFTQALTRIGEHLYEYAKEKHKMDVSITIDKLICGAEKISERFPIKWDFQTYLRVTA